MPRIKRLHTKLRRHIESTAARHRRQPAQHRLHIFARVQRPDICCVAVLRLSPRAFRVFFLQMPRIFQRKRRQFNRRLVRINLVLIAVARQARQPSRMVQVRMRQHAIINRRGTRRQRLEITLLQFARPLKYSAVDQQLLPRRLHQIFRTRNRPRRSPKRQLRHWPLRNTYSAIDLTPFPDRKTKFWNAAARSRFRSVNHTTKQNEGGDCPALFRSSTECCSSRLLKKPSSVGTPVYPGKGLRALYQGNDFNLKKSGQSIGMRLKCSFQRPARANQATSKRSLFMTLAHAATKSFANFSPESEHA